MGDWGRGPCCPGLASPLGIHLGSRSWEGARVWPGRRPGSRSRVRSIAPGHFYPSLAESVELQREVHFLGPQTSPSRPSSPHRPHETVGGPQQEEWLCYCHLGLGRKARGDLSPPMGLPGSGDLFSQEGVCAAALGWPWSCGQTPQVLREGLAQNSRTFPCVSPSCWSHTILFVQNNSPWCCFKWFSLVCGVGVAAGHFSEIPGDLLGSWVENAGGN